MTPKAFGPMIAHAVRAGLAHQFALALAALGAALGVPGGEHDQALHAVLAAVGDDVGDLLGGHGDDREVDGLRRCRATERWAGTPSSVALVLGEGAGSPRTARPVKPAVAEVAQDAAAHAAGGAAGADDGDGAGGEQPLHGAGLGALLAGALHGEGAVGGFEVELEADGRRPRSCASGCTRRP